ncbi:hypothetical protein [Actinacidiphila glaucinigra]|uniref:hypothetical protein n=1 Tax=Actinacidiphila glaucinigra TaxID=235986 RepID=UPI003D8D4A30
MIETNHIAVVTAAESAAAAGGPAARSPDVVKTTATRREVRAQGTAAHRSAPAPRCSPSR